MAQVPACNRPWRRLANAVLVLAGAASLACHDSLTEPAAGASPTPTAVRPPVAFTSTGGGCDPILSKSSTLTADVCACVAEPMTVVVDAGAPQPLACGGTVEILSGSVVTVSTARWSITEKLGVVDPHCWIAARLVCNP